MRRPHTLWMEITVVVAAISPPALVLIACSAPDYRFGTLDSGGSSPDGVGSNHDDGGSADTGAPADVIVIPEAAAPLAPIVLDADGGADFAANCANVDPAIYAFVKSDTATTKRHCYLYFAAKGYQRTWSEALVACTQITTNVPSRKAHLATFPTEEQLTLVQQSFKSGQVPWIGLRLDDGKSPTDKGNWHWIDNQATGFDGWAPAYPTGETNICAAWAAGVARYGDTTCYLEKGFLCEVDE